MSDTRVRVQGIGCRLAATILAWVVGVAGVHATNIWTGTGNWNSSTNWSDSHVPTNGDDVLINGTVVLTNSTANLASYTLNAARTQTNDGWGTVLSATLMALRVM